jgi:hypothetical protein
MNNWDDLQFIETNIESIDLSNTDDKKEHISNENKDILYDMIKELEIKTGKKFQISIHEFRENMLCSVGDFNNRSIKVYKVDVDYEDLLGDYDSISSFSSKLKSLHETSVFDQIKKTKIKGEEVTIGCCKKCHSYNDHIKPTRVESLFCNGCQCKLSSKWQTVMLRYDSGEIQQIADDDFFALTIGNFDISFMF